MQPAERFLGRGLAEWLQQRSRLEILAIGLVLIGIIGAIDYSIDHEYATSIFYLVPILLAAWFAGWDFGCLLCLVSAVVWFISLGNGPTLKEWRLTGAHRITEMGLQPNSVRV